ncbi:MAG: hypothetical protein ACOZF0_07575 [Thermodesulfobacteriota bacterium]
MQAMEPMKRQCRRSWRMAWSFRLAAAMLLLMGCAPAQKNWSSVPAVRSLETPCMTVRLELIKENQAFFTWFQLEVVNRSDRDIVIDWNRTRYIYNGKAAGGFVFYGMDPRTVKEQTIPDEVVAPGRSLTKKIAPLKLVALAPMRDRNIAPDQGGISPGIVPAGINGLRLAAACGGKPVRKEIAVTVSDGQRPDPAP